MCFSAPASFIASGGLAVLGGASFVVAKKKNKILAAIPLMFAVQQFCEGIQWLYLNSGSTSQFAGYSFLFFAFILWPVYVPWFVYVLDPKRRKLLGWFVALGALVSAYFIFLLSTQVLEISKHISCVNYSFSDFPYKEIVITAYLVAILAPLLSSSKHILRWYGAAIFVLGLISWLFFSVTFTSVWCFFAAIVSSMFFFYLLPSKYR